MLDNLPDKVDVLLSIGFCEAAGYKFVDEIPPAFRSVPTYDHQLDFQMENYQFKNLEHEQLNPEEQFLITRFQSPYNNLATTETQLPSFIDKVYGLDEVIHDNHKDGLTPTQRAAPR